MLLCIPRTSIKTRTLFCVICGSFYLLGGFGDGGPLGRRTAPQFKYFFLNILLMPDVEFRFRAYAGER